MSTTRTRRDSKRAWSILGFNNQSSQAAVTHNPNPTRVEPASLSDSELLQCTSKLLQHFEELRNIKRIELSDKRILAIREKIEKAMPRLQALATGSPVPTPKAVSVKAFAEKFLSNFPDADIPSLRPNADAVKNGSPKATLPPAGKPTTTATSSTALAAPAPISCGLSSRPGTPSRRLANGPVQTQMEPPETPAHHPPLVRKQSVQVAPQPRTLGLEGQHISDGHLSRAPAALPVTDGMYQAPPRVAISQKDMLMAVHDLVNGSSFQWGGNVSTFVDKSDAHWQHPPCGLSPDEFENFQHGSKTVLGGGHGLDSCIGTATLGMSNVVPAADLHGRMSGGPFIREYMRSMPTGHDFTGNVHIHHRSSTDRRVGDGRRQKQRTSTESIVK